MQSRIYNEPITIKINFASSEAFTAVTFQVELFWVVTPCSVAEGYQRFGGPCCLQLHGEEKAQSQLRRPRIEYILTILL